MARRLRSTEPDYPLVPNGDVGFLRWMGIVTGPLGALLVRDATCRIPDTRDLCMPAVGKRGRVRSVALVTRERPVHERTPTRAERAPNARRLTTRVSVGLALGSVTAILEIEGAATTRRVADARSASS